MKRLSLVTLFYFLAPIAFSQTFISATHEPGALSLSAPGVTISTDDKDDWLVHKAAALLQQDMEAATGKKPMLVTGIPASSKNIIIIGSVHGSALIRQLAAQKIIAIAGITGKWEAFQIQVVSRPWPGIDNALVIAGSDKRGTAYGVFELSKQIGVSPWYWWADVPVKKANLLFMRKGPYVFNSPSVQYRGIFINDEAPAFSGWTREKFGGVNHLVYEKIFELILRLKGNFLWPAMWGNAFNDDDTLNPVLADKWGIVMGTSHHEPMMRAQQEWKRYGKGPWDYTKNDSVLRAFWKKGIENMGRHESLVTVGMRGDGDMPMTAGTATGLLEKIVADQRAIIASVTGKPAAQTPQVWALYKEVQDYYDKGMRVPDDVTLLISDDNWGNIRRLPAPGSPKRAGGYGIYYHFDYVGDPRNYKWINDNNLSRVWEQLHMADAYGVNKLWVVNVGDLKPMELPMSFFLDYAYDTKKWNAHNILTYYTEWARQQFGPEHAPVIGDILNRYSVYAARRKPELLDAATYSVRTGEADRVLKQWTDLNDEAERLKDSLPVACQDAYFELVLHPVKAFTTLHQLYHAVAMNHCYTAEKNGQANYWADEAKQFYLNDSLLTLAYNHDLAGGKWDHMMDQTHIGYTYWQQPPINRMPEVHYIKADSAVSHTALTPGNAALPAARIQKKGASPAFVQHGGYLSMGATHYSKAVGTAKVSWTIIPDVGKYGDGITTFPVTMALPLSAASPHLDYEVITTGRDSLRLLTYFSPTLNFTHAPQGLRFAVSVDGEQPQIVRLNQEDNTPVWNTWVADDIIIKTTRHFISAPGKHVIRYWLIDPGVILQQLVLDFGGLAPSYFGPPESSRQ